MRIYATTGDLTTWITPATAPDNAASLLRSASILIESKTMAATYATDTDGYPTTGTTRETFRDATCAQAQAWATNGLDPAAGEVAEASKRQAASKSINGASVSYESAEAGRQARIAALTGLSPEAHRILAGAGLLIGSAAYG